MIITLDVFRKQCNIADYSGDIVPESTVKDCVKQAKELLPHRVDKLWIELTQILGSIFCSAQ